MEIAGVALGGIPLIISALENYRKCATFFKDYSDYDALLDRKKDYLWIQQEQINITLSSIGIEDMSMEAIGAYLHQNHPDKSERYTSIILRMKEISQIVAGKLNGGSPNQVRSL
jgi:hypothetical protein